jgi:hypothetical protein
LLFQQRPFPPLPFRGRVAKLFNGNEKLLQKQPKGFSTGGKGERRKVAELGRGREAFNI